MPGLFTVKAPVITKCTFMSSLDSLTLITGQYANSSVTITPPAATPSGNDVTVTLEAKSSSGADSNYIVLRFSVVTKVSRHLLDILMERVK